MSPVLRDLVHEVLPHFGLEHLGEDAVTGSDRHAQFAAARHVCMWVARKRLGWSFPELGREFGQRDHTTIMSACRRVERALAQEPESRLAVVAREALVSWTPAAKSVLKLTGARELDTFAPTLSIELDLTGAPFAGAAE